MKTHGWWLTHVAPCIRGRIDIRRDIGGFQATRAARSPDETDHTADDDSTRIKKLRRCVMGYHCRVCSVLQTTGRRGLTNRWSRRLGGRLNRRAQAAVRCVQGYFGGAAQLYVRFHLEAVACCTYCWARGTACALRGKGGRVSRLNTRMSLSVLNLVGFVLVMAANYLAIALPLGGNTTGQISDQYPNLFVPAGLTFSIWAVIYLLLALFLLYGLLSSIRRPSATGSFVDRIGPLFMLSCLANAGWVFAWHYRHLLLSLGCMAVLLLSLVGIYFRLNVGRSAAALLEKCLVHLAISVYLGWITIATIANLTAVAVGLGWNWLSAGGQPWATAMVALGTLIALIVLFRRADVFYALVVDWAALGILIKRLTHPTPQAPWVVAASMASLSLLTLAVAFQCARRKIYR